MDVKNIIFDLGGVILNIDYNKTVNAFKSLGIEDFDLLFTKANQEQLFDLYEMGQISSLAFIDKLKDKIPDTTTEQVKNAWNAMLLDLPNERLTLLKELKAKYNISLLSNTNKIHLDAFHEIIQTQNRINSLEPYFDKVYFSCDIGMRKPNPQIFDFVCNQQNYKPNETLFIDDSIQHIRGAKKIGLQAYHLNVEKEDVVSFFNDFKEKGT